MIQSIFTKWNNRNEKNKQIWIWIFSRVSHWESQWWFLDGQIDLGNRVLQSNCLDKSTLNPLTADGKVSQNLLTRLSVCRSGDQVVFCLTSVLAPHVYVYQCTGHLRTTVLALSAAQCNPAVGLVCQSKHTKHPVMKHITLTKQHVVVKVIKSQ